MNKFNITFLFLLFGFSTVHAQIGRLDLSPRETTKQRIGLTDVTIDYSRPSMRGRAIFGTLVPYDKLWRTGANRNTTIAFTEDVIINNKTVKKGKYAIFSKPGIDKWKIYFYADTNNWNVPEKIDENKIVATIEIAAQTNASKVESLKISIGHFTNYNFEMDIEWDRAIVSVPIQLTTRKMMEEIITNEMQGPTYEDYYAAAQYEMESGKNLQRGLNWINKAMEITDQVTWWDYRIKAQLLLEKGDLKEARQYAEKGLTLAEIAKRDYGIREFKRILEEIGN